MRKDNINIIKIVLIAITLFLLLRTFIIDIHVVRQHSMSPTLPPGTVVITFKLAYGLRNPLKKSYLFNYHYPSKGDIVIFNDENNSEQFIKRVDHAKNGTNFFLLGDNKKHSTDSRIIGYIPLGDIEGKAIFVIYPLNKFGFVN